MQRKKSKKAALIAKKSVLLDVKPWDDEPAMAEITNTEGLNSGATKVSNQ